MYGKIFDSMYEGTLYGHWQAIVTLQQMIVLCDSSGVIDMTPQAISARTSIPLDIILKGIEVLSQPDPYSRTPDEDGKRISLLDERRPWGWILVNHAKYQKLKSMEEKHEADRLRIAEKRKANKNNDVADSRNMSRGVADVAHADADADADKTTGAKASPPPCPHLEILALYRKHLPMGRQPDAELWGGTRARHLQARWRENPKRQSLEWWEKWFAYIAESDFLTGKVTPKPGHKPFEISIDWIVRPENFTKIHEGAYNK